MNCWKNIESLGSDRKKKYVSKNMDRFKNIETVLNVGLRTV